MTGAARRLSPGLALALLGAAAGAGIHFLVPAVPWLTASLVLGIIVGCFPVSRRFLEASAAPGLAVAARRLLRAGIVVLGLQLGLGDIVELGWLAIAGIVALVLVSFALTWFVARLLRLPGDEPFLLAAGFSICGVSAIGAMSAARGSRPEDSALPVTLVTLYGSAALVVLPVLAGYLGLGPEAFGRWTGASVHDVGQVVATAQVAGAGALAVAVVVKLARVLLLAPMVAVASLATRRAHARDGVSGTRPPVVPLFIAGFAALVLVRTFLDVPPGVLEGAAILQSVLLAAALFAIGASLRLERLLRSGLRGLVAGAISWAAILGLALPLALLT